MVLRFPNPGADLDRMLLIFRLICRDAVHQNLDGFDLDFMVKGAALNFQASSRGAIGKNAISRSTQLDRSRDPLYNQMKSYSEIYRNLGLLRPTSKRLKFCTTTLGYSLAIDFEGHEIAKGIAKECLLAMTFPNQTSENIGTENFRPFRWLLMLMDDLGGLITRHEIIVGLLDVQDDRESGLFQKKVNQIRKLRQLSRADLMKAVSRVAQNSGIQTNTLENYTRFPVGVMNSPITLWAESKTLSGLYDRKMKGLELTDIGRATARRMKNAIDIRSSDLQNFQHSERANFAQFAYYSMLYRSGVRQNELERAMDDSKKRAAVIVEHFDILIPDSFIYSPHLEESDEVLALAESKN